jgi:PAS domain S-box-containing protein
MGIPLKNDRRISEILTQVRRFSAGDFSQQVDTSHNSDEVDAVITSLNELGASLQVREVALKKKEKRIQGLLEVLRSYRALDFAQCAGVDEEADEINALASGLNALGEEMIYHINKLKNSEAQIQTIFNHAPDAVVVIDSKNRILRWNPAATRIFGWQQEEVVGKFLSDILVPERYREKHLAGMKHFVKTGEGPVINRTVELPALRKDNSEIEVELTISAARIDTDYLFISFLRDITERKKSEEKIRELNASLERRVLERGEQLNISETKYRHLFENNPMPLWVLDAETLRFLDVNESAVQLYGYTREEFLSMTTLDIRPEEEKTRYLTLKRTALGTRNTGIWKHLKKDGSVIESEVTVHEMLFGGKPARLVLANDVTEKTKALRELQLSEARFRRVVDSKMTGFLFWDEDGKITDANDLFLEMVGYSRTDVEEGRLDLRAITPWEYAEVEKRAVEQIRLNGVCEPFEKEYVRKDGTLFPVMVGAANINDGPSIKGVSCVMDISQRKKMEQEILELNRDLETRISQRTQALQEANKELESFSYSVSHDLRAPLRAIHGYSQMLFEDYAAKLDQEGIRLLNAVKFNAKRMGQLVDDLLAFSRMGKRALSETETDLTSLVLDIVKELGVANNDRVKVSVRSLGCARADETLIRQAFHNLISNALKYSSKKARAEVEIGRTETDGIPTYYVKDNGAGFDMAYYKKLFGVFQRLHEQEEFEGTGVGLAIVQRIIHRHGGSIWAEGKVGEGAVFYFMLEKPSPLG